MASNLLKNVGLGLVGAGATFYTVKNIIPDIANEKARSDFVNDKVCVRINFCSE